MSTRHARVADKELNEKHTRILIDLLQKPENRICADCRKKDPRWASWNLGIFICIRCSGTHRSLGTHISKVKSVDLDTWTPEQIESMINWGNQRANIYWEANLDGRQPSDYSMDVWIRAKYEQKRWVQKDEFADSSSSLEIEDNNRKEEKVLKEEAKINEKDVNRENDLKKEFEATYQKFATLVAEKKDAPIENAPQPTKIQEKSKPKEEIKSTYRTEPSQQTTTTTSNGFKLDMSSFQQQLSGLSMGRPSSGLIPQAPPGSNSSWTNFLIDQNKGMAEFRNNSLLNEPSKEKPLISYEALASLRRA